MRFGILAAAAACVVAAAPAAAYTPQVYTGFLDQGSGSIGIPAGGGKHLIVDFSKPVDRVQGAIYWFASIGASYCDEAHTIECFNNYSDSHGEFGFFGLGKQRFVVDNFVVLNGFFGDTYVVDGALIGNGGYFNYINGSRDPISYRLTFADGIPEPGAWVLMLAGFGAVGFSMRNRKRQAAIGQSFP